MTTPMTRCAGCSTRPTVVTHPTGERCPAIPERPTFSETGNTDESRRMWKKVKGLDDALSFVPADSPAAAAIRAEVARVDTQLTLLADARRDHQAATAGDLYDHHGRQVRR